MPASDYYARKQIEYASGTDDNWTDIRFAAEQFITECGYFDGGITAESLEEVSAAGE